MGAQIEGRVFHMQVQRIGRELNEQVADTKTGAVGSSAMKPSRLAASAITVGWHAQDTFCAVLTPKVKRLLKWCIECPLSRYVSESFPLSRGLMVALT